VADPPLRTPLDPDIRVLWAHWGRPHDMWYGAADYPMRENLDRWIASGSPLTMTEYYTDAFASPSIIPPVAAAMDRDTAWLVEQGFDGNASLMFPHTSWWAYSLNAWLAVSWHRSASAMDLLDDYCEHYFGAAREPMRRYHRLLAEHLWIAGWCCGPRWTAPVFADVARVEEASALLDGVEAALDAAERLELGALDRYRASRPIAQGRALVTMGRARAANMPLVVEHDRVRSSGGADELAALRARLERAAAHEHDVVEPAVLGLRDLAGVLPYGFESERMVGYGAAIRAALDELVPAGGST
jgi:hypothetical protein